MTDYIGRIKQLREEHNKTQKEIAELLGMSESRYARIENREIDLNVNHLILLRDYYQVQADWICGIGEYAEKQE